MGRNQPTNPTPFSYTHVCEEKWEIVTAFFYSQPFFVLWHFCLKCPLYNRILVLPPYAAEQKNWLQQKKSMSGADFLAGNSFDPLFCRVRKGEKGEFCKAGAFSASFCWPQWRKPPPPSFFLLVPPHNVATLLHLRPKSPSPPLTIEGKSPNLPQKCMINAYVMLHSQLKI